MKHVWFYMRFQNKNIIIIIIYRTPVRETSFHIIMAVIDFRANEKQPHYGQVIREHVLSKSSLNSIKKVFVKALCLKESQVELKCFPKISFVINWYFCYRFIVSSIKVSKQVPNNNSCPSNSYSIIWKHDLTMHLQFLLNLCNIGLLSKKSTLQSSFNE